MCNYAMLERPALGDLKRAGEAGVLIWRCSPRLQSAPAFELRTGKWKGQGERWQCRDGAQVNVHYSLPPSLLSSYPFSLFLNKHS